MPTRWKWSVRSAKGSEEGAHRGRYEPQGVGFSKSLKVFQTASQRGIISMLVDCRAAAAAAPVVVGRSVGLGRVLDPPEPI